MTERIPRRIPPTRVRRVGPEPPLPTPVPAPRPDPKKTRMISHDSAAPVVGWLVALNGNHKGEDFRVREGKTTIGSAADCDVVLSDEYLSAKHATIKFMDREGERLFILSDLDSSNGTLLNDSEEQIAREELVDNDTVTFGQTRMKFKCL